MDRKNLLRSAYHAELRGHHDNEYRRVLGQPPRQPESTKSLDTLERFDRVYQRIEPLVRPLQLSSGPPWNLTPEVPIRGTVEGQTVSVGLSFNVQGTGDSLSIHPWANRNPSKAYDGRGLGWYISQDFCDLWAQNRPDEKLDELDHVEELVELYFKEIAKLSPEKLKQLGFPAELIESIAP